MTIFMLLLFYIGIGNVLICNRLKRTPGTVLLFVWQHGLGFALFAHLCWVLLWPYATYRHWRAQ